MDQCFYFTLLIDLA